MLRRQIRVRSHRGRSVSRPRTSLPQPLPTHAISGSHVETTNRADQPEPRAERKTRLFDQALPPRRAMRPLGSLQPITNAISWCPARTRGKSISGLTYRRSTERGTRYLNGGGQQLGDQGLDAVCDVVADHAPTQRRGSCAWRDQGVSSCGREHPGSKGRHRLQP